MSIPRLAVVIFVFKLLIPVTYSQELPQLYLNELIILPTGSLGIQVSPKALSFQGKKVRLSGYMVKSEESPIGKFYFSPIPIQLSEHADGAANDLPASAVLVKLDSSQANCVVAHKTGVIVLEGTLLVGRQEDAQGAVSWFQLQLPIH